MSEHLCKYETQIATMLVNQKSLADQQGKMDTKLDTLVEAMCGTPNGTKRGYNLRLAIVEKWKSTVIKIFATFLFLLVGTLLTIGLTKLLG